MLDCQLFGPSPGEPHAVNALLHAANSAILFILMSRLTGRFWPAALTAALFAVHPLRVESVAWVSERKDVLSGFFFLLSLLAYEQFVRRRLPGMFSVVAIFFACGLMSKPMVVTLPAILLLLDYWPLERVKGEGGRVVGERKPMNLEPTESASSTSPPTTLDACYPPPFTHHPPPFSRRAIRFYCCSSKKFRSSRMAIMSCFITMWAQHTARELNSKLSIVSRLQTACSAYLTYIEQAFWPRNLCPFYPVSIVSPPVSQIYLALAVVGAVGILALLLAKKRPYVITGWLWFLGMLIPVIGIVPVGGQSHADRYTYLPHIGIYMAVAFGLADLMQHGGRSVRALATIATAVVLALLAVGAWRQAAYWITPETLWRHSLAIDDSNHLAHSQLGDLYFIGKNYPMAKAEFEKALKTGPKNLIARMELGAVLAEQGQIKEAEKQFRQVIADSPSLPNSYAELGELLANRKYDYPGAIECLNKALALQPDDEESHIAIAVALAENESARRGCNTRFDRAETHGRQVGACPSEFGQPACLGGTQSRSRCALPKGLGTLAGRPASGHGFGLDTGNVGRKRRR